MVVVRFVFDLANKIENPLLAAPLDILLESGRHSRLFGPVPANSASLFNQPIIERKVRRQGGLPTQ